MTDAVMADAQFGVAKVLKPYLNFESDYQGVSGSKPIAIPGNLDQKAGTAGYNSALLGATAVPFGSKIVLWLPTLRRTFQSTVVEYRYQILFRLRNVLDFQLDRKAYHYPRQGVGENNEVVVPACQQGVIYEGVEPQTTGSGASADAFQRLVGETYTPTSEVAQAPFVPGGGGDAVYQQGLGNNSKVTFAVMQLDCTGDEMIILATKSNGANWDFDASGQDSGFSEFFGTADGARSVIRDTGIYVFTGSNP